jgi:Phage endonuclease I
MYKRNYLSRKKHPNKGKTVKQPKSKKYYEIKSGFRSGLEEQIQELLSDEGVDAKYEELVIKYTEPEKQRKYTPDWELPNKVLIEAKGRFVTADRQKHLLIKSQFPDLQVKFIFYNSNATLSKRSKTTYADWCNKNGFEWADWKKDREKIKGWFSDAKN